MKLQKKTLRLVNGAGKYDNTVHIFEKYELLNRRNLNMYFVYRYSFAFMNTTRKLYQKYSSIFLNEQSCPWSSYSTEKYFHVHLCKSLHGSKYLRYSGAKINNYMT